MFTSHQMSHFKCHVSHDFFFYKVLELVSGGSVINGAYPVQFLISYRLSVCITHKSNSSQIALWARLKKKHLKEIKLLFTILRPCQTLVSFWILKIYIFLSFCIGPTWISQSLLILSTQDATKWENYSDNTTGWLNLTMRI